MCTCVYVLLSHPPPRSLSGHRGRSSECQRIMFDSGAVRAFQIIDYLESVDHFCDVTHPFWSNPSFLDVLDDVI